MEFQRILSDRRITEMSARGLWGDRLLIDYLDDIAANRPDSTAIVEFNSASEQVRRISYGELRRLSLRIAVGLARHGIGRGDVVAMQMPNWWHYAAVYTACVRIGAVINPLMPSFRERELEYMLGFSEAKTLIIPQEFRGFDYPAMVARMRGSLPALRNVFVVNGTDAERSFESRLQEREWELEPDAEAILTAGRPGANDVTEIMYTSGTTGKPKGVMHTCNTLLCMGLLATELFNLRRDDAIFMGSPVAHHTGFMYGVILSIYGGHKCVLLDAWEPGRAAQLIESEKCTITFGSTPFLSDLVRAPATHGRTLPTLRLFGCGGAPIPSAVVADANARYPGLFVMSAFGMTEMGIVTATYPGDPLEKVLGTDGRALPHQMIRIVDDAGAPVEVGKEGRLQTRAVTLFVGYLKRPEDYSVDSDSWFDTGDLARMDAEGFIRITGRSKDIIIRGGENVPVVEIEDLLHRHPAIATCAIVAMPDDRLGERVCAFATLREGQTLDFASMCAYLEKSRLMKGYWPERLELLDALPRTPSGKIQKFVLRDMARDLKPMRLSRSGPVS